MAKKDVHLIIEDGLILSIRRRWDEFIWSIPSHDETRSLCVALDREITDLYQAYLEARGRAVVSKTYDRDQLHHIVDEFCDQLDQVERAKFLEYKRCRAPHPMVEVMDRIEREIEPESEEHV